MNNRTLFMLFFVVVALLFLQSFSLETEKKPVKNITVIGTVFCDACSNNTFSKHSYFIQGAKVHVDCKLKSNSNPNGEMSITVDRTTDRFGVYKLDIPPVDGFVCTEGQEPESFCRATLVSSSSLSCDVPCIKSSAEHIAVKNEGMHACLYNLNALSYRPAKKYSTSCGTKLTAETESSSTPNACLFFWPPFPPFGFPWPPPFPFPPLFPSPPSLPFPPLFPSPPSLPFPFPPIPFLTPPPPSFPFPLPPLWPTPSPPPFMSQKEVKGQALTDFLATIWCLILPNYMKTYQMKLQRLT
ncbi:RNA-binding protein 12-like [Asparagus officinalis]|uniref:RNA-binding protein 12-like n=1 Tax=Asparagus officinalis TaxID=4686 RepID=UPI00098E6435|nr:RNA-binding protein 12-like [Asparagus officinalis]